MDNDPAIDKMHEYTDRLLYRMYLTKGARYQAARRHQRRAAASIWSVTALSMYVFTTSTIASVYNLEKLGALQNNLLVVNIVMSAFIIAFSVLEQGKKHDLKAELFLRCAQGIQELRDELEFHQRAGEVTRENVLGCLKKYNALVHDFSDNHSETDYRTFRINVRKDEGDKIYSWYISFKYWLDCWSLMLLAIFVPPMTMAYLVFAALK